MSVARARQQLRSALTKTAQKRSAMACGRPQLICTHTLMANSMPQAVAAFERHLTAAADCASVLAASAAPFGCSRLSLYERAPESLRRKVGVAPVPPARSSAYPGAWRWLAVAAALIIALIWGSRLCSTSRGTRRNKPLWARPSPTRIFALCNPAISTDVESTDHTPSSHGTTAS